MRWPCPEREYRDGGVGGYQSGSHVSVDSLHFEGRLDQQQSISELFANNSRFAARVSHWWIVNRQIRRTFCRYYPILSISS